MRVLTSTNVAIPCLFGLNIELGALACLSPVKYMLTPTALHYCMFPMLVGVVLSF